MVWALWTLCFLVIMQITQMKHQFVDQCICLFWSKTMKYGMNIMSSLFFWSSCTNCSNQGLVLTSTHYLPQSETVKYGANIVITGQKVWTCKVDAIERHIELTVLLTTLRIFELLVLFSSNQNSCCMYVKVCNYSDAIVQYIMHQSHPKLYTTASHDTNTGGRLDIWSII
jgi:hypothetical protein